MARSVTPDDLPAPPRDDRDPRCGVERTLDVIGPKWTMLVLRELLGGRRRFGELRSALGVSPKTLTDRLRELESHGVLERTVYAEVPPRVEYALTERGRALGPVIAAMARWGATEGSPEGREATDREAADSGLEAGTPVPAQRV